MNKFISFYLLLLLVFFTQFNSFKSEEDESGGGGGGAAAAPEEPVTGEPANEAEKSEGKSEESVTESTKKSEEAPTESQKSVPKSAEKSEDNSPIGSNDGKCDCCAGEGVKCGLRLNWCGSKECVHNHLYYCDKDNKKAYEYERCRGLCITEYKDFPDYCAIVIDDHIFYPKLSKFMAIKKEIKNSVLSLNKTFHESVNKLSHSLVISPEERAIVEKKQAERELRNKEKMERAAKIAKNIKEKVIKLKGGHKKEEGTEAENPEQVVTQQTSSGQDTSSEQTVSENTGPVE